MDTISPRTLRTPGRIRVAVLLLLAGGGFASPAGAVPFVHGPEPLLHEAPATAETMSIASGDPVGGRAPYGLPGLSALVLHPEGPNPGRATRGRASSTSGAGGGLHGDREKRRSSPWVSSALLPRPLPPGAEAPTAARDALARAGRFAAPSTAPPVSRL